MNEHAPAGGSDQKLNGNPRPMGAELIAALSAGHRVNMTAAVELGTTLSQSQQTAAGDVETIGRNVRSRVSSCTTRPASVSIRILSGRGETEMVRLPDLSVRTPDKDRICARAGLHSLSTSAPSDGTGCAAPSRTGRMVIRIVCVLTAETFNSTGVDPTESDKSGASERAGLMIAVVPAASTAFTTSLRLN